VLDPVGAWWGLRSSADGKSDGLPLPVLGGAHGDVPLQAAAGALLADVVVDTGQSLVLDLSDFSKTEQRRFVTDFAERLYTRKARNRALLHLVLEEADEFAPQRVSAGDARMVGAIEQLVRRGRGRGIGLTMITQRSASLNKSVLEQTDVLIVMRTTGPRDRAASRALGREAGRRRRRRRPPVAVRPRDRRGLDLEPRARAARARPDPARAHLRFLVDAEGRRAPHRAGAAAAIDLTKLGAEIEATAERAKETNDPDPRSASGSARRAAKRASSSRCAAPPTPRPPQAAASNGRVSGPQQRILDALAALEAIGISDAHKTQLALFAQASPKSSSYSNNLGALRTAGLIDYPAGGRVHLTPDGRAVADGSAAPTSTDELHRFVYDLVGGSKARLLEQLVARYPRALEKEQLAELAGASATSSSFSNNLGSLRSLGLIDYPRPGEVAALPVLFLEERA
jgi:hypothetical protein